MKPDVREINRQSQDAHKKEPKDQYNGDRRLTRLR
jgi:hypothetical protein